ncbi:CDP-alcohol phosphatidyltransferase family protein [Tropicimonas sp. IMCC34043]|uniref:CDP-alcohol phosphatidyltransferase family protein n=1 Tax=Tropicimonas sp. IMCC34043 TaxID=2248760 RepID=UPI00130082F1|nr:CDP-alcohol phosphatidyltransferase family protein [Tropicimonas sp. IMCC34043]
MMQQDISRVADRLEPGSPIGSVRRGLRIAGIAGLVIWLALHVALFGKVSPIHWMPGLIVLLGGLAVIDRLMPSRYPHDAFGACNAVTLIRGVLAVALVTPLVAGTPQSWAVFAVAFVAVLLDGVDGRLARQSGLVSGFGARFDMETDSFLALVLALHALADGLAWPLAMILGASRFIFLGAAMLAPWLGRPLPQRFGRKVVCVFQLSVLVALQAPPVSGWPAVWLAAAAATAVLASFGRDIVWLWTQPR